MITHIIVTTLMSWRLWADKILNNFYPASSNWLFKSIFYGCFSMYNVYFLRLMQHYSIPQKGIWSKWRRATDSVCRPMSLRVLFHLFDFDFYIAMLKEKKTASCCVQYFVGKRLLQLTVISIFNKGTDCFYCTLYGWWKRLSKGNQISLGLRT